MAARRYREIVCEGPDDLAALRALLLAEEGVRKKHPASPGSEHGAQRFELGDLQIGVQFRGARSGRAKSGLAELTIDVAEGSAISRPDMVLVSFDPDADPPAREFAFFERDFDAHTGPRGRTGPLRKEGGRRVFTIKGRDVEVLPAPWRSSEPTFAGLDDEHSMERVMIDGIVRSASAAALLDWARDSTTSLIALVEKHGYKRAFRIWNAALHPEAEAFVARLLQGEHKSGCFEALRATPAARALVTLLGP